MHFVDDPSLPCIREISSCVFLYEWRVIKILHKKLSKLGWIDIMLLRFWNVLLLSRVDVVSIYVAVYSYNPFLSPTDNSPTAMLVCTFCCARQK